jgi:hypothetical protein
VGAKHKSGWTDLIADIFDDQKIDGMQIQTRQRIIQHNGIQMAFAAGINLNSGYSGWKALTRPL